jgi:hypothetical protein
MLGKPRSVLLLTALGFALSCVVLPANAGVFRESLASTGDVDWHIAMSVVADSGVMEPWKHVAWPILIGEWLALLFIGGGLLTYAVRRERREASRA